MAQPIEQQPCECDGVSIDWIRFRIFLHGKYREQYANMDFNSVTSVEAMIIETVRMSTILKTLTTRISSIVSVQVENIVSHEAFTSQQAYARILMFAS